MTYKNIVPEKRFQAVSIQLEGNHLGVDVNEIYKATLEKDIPVESRPMVILPILCWLEIFISQETLTQALREADWTMDEEAQIEVHNQPDAKIIENVRNTLDYVKKNWPYDYRAAKHIISDRESATAYVHAAIPSQVQSAFVPEGSKGFIRNSSHQNQPGSAPLAGIYLKRKGHPTTEQTILSFLSKTNPFLGIVATKELEFSKKPTPKQ